MPDLRESILERLTVIAGEVPGITTARRNVSGISESARPAIVVLDTDEAVDEEQFGGRRPFNAPTLVVMTPEIFILATKRSEDIGAELNAFRRRVIRRVLEDTALRDLVGSNGDIRYAGCATALATGRTMEGEMALSFAFRYPLLPSQLED